MHVEEARKTHSFFKGISLSQYMRDVCCPEGIDDENDDLEETNDLLLQCQPQQKITNYAIQEIIDEENYDQNKDVQLVVKPHHNFDLQKARVVHIEEVKTKARGNPIKRSNYHMLKNGPLKDPVSPKKQMFQSLYGHSFGNSNPQNSPQRLHLLSTLGMNSWRGKHKSLNRKYLDQKQKNKRQYQQLIKYQNVISQRLDTKLNGIRIDGVKDKIFKRNQKYNKKEYRL